MTINELKKPFYARLLIIAALLHLCAAWFSLGSYFEPSEFAAYKAGYILFEDLPRYLTIDYHDLKIRSAFLDSIAYGAFQILPDNANVMFTTKFILRLLSVILAFAASLVFFLAYQSEIKSEMARRWVLAAMLLCWVMVFFHARFSSDGWIASFLLLAFASLRWNRFLLTGVAFGMAFVVRYQAGFILLPIGLWVLLILRPKWRDIALLVAGGVPVLLGSFLLDWWFYGEPTLPWLNYLQWNLDNSMPDGGAYHFPSLRYWTYGGAMLAPIGYILPIVLVAFWVKFPRHPLVWATVLYIILHLYLHNREPRFMYPILVFMPFITAMVWQEVIEQRAVLRRVFLWLLKITAVVNVPLLAFAAFYPAAKEIKLLRDCVLPNMQDGTPAYYYAQGKTNRMAQKFYLRDKTMTPVQDESELRELLLSSGESEALYISRKQRDKQLEENGLAHTRLCAAVPDWILQININNWTARSGIYPVYRVEVE